MEKHIQNILGIIAFPFVLSGVVVGLFTWNINKGVDFYFKEVNFVTKPLFIAFESAITKAVELHK